MWRRSTLCSRRSFTKALCQPVIHIGVLSRLTSTLLTDPQSCFSTVPTSISSYPDYLKAEISHCLEGSMAIVTTQGLAHVRIRAMQHTNILHCKSECVSCHGSDCPQLAIALHLLKVLPLVRERGVTPLEIIHQII